jgi:hypothetical protein
MKDDKGLDHDAISKILGSTYKKIERPKFGKPIEIPKPMYKTFQDLVDHKEDFVDKYYVISRESGKEYSSIVKDISIKDNLFQIDTDGGWIGCDMGLSSLRMSGKYLSFHIPYVGQAWLVSKEDKSEGPLV